LLTFSNTRGLKTGKIVQDIFTTTKIGALALLILLALFVGRSENAAIHTTNFWTPLVNGNTLSTLAAVSELFKTTPHKVLINRD